MIELPKTYFRWREPDHNSRRSSIVVRMRFLRLLGVIVISSVVFLLLLQQLYSIPILKTLLALALIVLFITAIYYVTVKVHPYVVVGKNHIYRGLNDETADEWKYKNIAYCEFSTKAIDGSIYNTMVIETRKGERSLILMPPTISVEALRSFLVAKGIQAQDCPTRRCS